MLLFLALTHSLFFFSLSDIYAARAAFFSVPLSLFLITLSVTHSSLSPRLLSAEGLHIRICQKRYREYISGMRSAMIRAHQAAGGFRYRLRKNAGYSRGVERRYV